jgi:DNA replication ATP-dependent helicase Dna2
MHIGTIVHEILQTVLKDNLTTFEEIKKVSDDYLQDKSILQILFACKITLDDIEAELEPFLNRIHEFVRFYIVGDEEQKVNGNQNVKQFQGRIAEIADIEENLWSPRLGLKGKIDVTVKVNPRNNFFNSFQKTLPLEIKTGRASFSLEHKGQLILYQMMMQDLGKQVDAGLLLYIKDCIMAEITTTSAETRGLIQMRNRLTQYLGKDIVEKDLMINLPEPINHHSACGKCEYNTICSSFLKLQDLKISDNNPLKKLNLSQHLSQQHLEYFITWCQLICLEQSEDRTTVKLRHIWTKDPETRAAKGNALINLEISDLVKPLNGEYLHIFKSKIDLNLTNFNIGDYVIVSIKSRCSIAAGRIIDIQDRSLSLILPRNLSVQYQKEKFYVDRYESQSQSVFNFSNIGALLNETENANRLRKIIIDKEKSRFTSTLSSSFLKLTSGILSKLNHMQQKAVVKAVTCENYCLIKGYAGAGKSQTLVAFVRVLIAMKKSILITSHTNSAVDNLLLRIKDYKFKFIRLGSISRIHPDLKSYHESSLISECHTVEDLEKVYDEFPIVATTCLGSAHALLTRRKFDFCLVDEATQIFQPTVIRPLFSADKFILVGDPQQLSPLVRNSDCRLLGGILSLFERLDNPDCTFVLGLQYRMNRVITKLANNLTYNGELKCANESVEKATIQIPDKDRMNKIISDEKWLSKLLSTNIDQSCVLVDTHDTAEKSMELQKKMPKHLKIGEEKSKSFMNFYEAGIVLHLIKVLNECKVPRESIGVIAPYRSQVELLRKSLKSYENVEVNTIDQYQGRDKEIIIYSCTQMRTMSKEEIDSSSDVQILQDHKRLTVAITRAKQKLIMIGDVECLQKFTPFKNLFNFINKVSKVSLDENSQNFNWNSISENLKIELE